MHRHGDLLFVTCGLGGGTGSSSVVSKYGKEAGSIVISTVTLPFKMEGARVLPEYKGKVQVITIITGVKSPYILGKGEEVQQTREQSRELGISTFNF